MYRAADVWYIFFVGHNRGHAVEPCASLAAYISVVIYLLLGILYTGLH